MLRSIKTEQNSLSSYSSINSVEMSGISSSCCFTTKQMLEINLFINPIDDRYIKYKHIIIIKSRIFLTISPCFNMKCYGHQTMKTFNANSFVFSVTFVRDLNDLNVQQKIFKVTFIVFYKLIKSCFTIYIKWNREIQLTNIFDLMKV